jgi:mannose/fructose/N-acetylgalactosamine-specific phosphotransferase system component IIC
MTTQETIICVAMGVIVIGVAVFYFLRELAKDKKEKGNKTNQNQQNE